MLQLAAAGGVGYYLYSAGGSPKAAEKRLEADVASLSSSTKSHLPGSSTEVKKQGEVLSADAGAKFDELKRDASKAVSNVDAKLADYRSEAEKKLAQGKAELEARTAEARAKGLEAADKFDVKVGENVKEVKKAAGSWFGGK